MTNTLEEQMLKAKEIVTNEFLWNRDNIVLEMLRVVLAELSNGETIKILINNNMLNVFVLDYNVSDYKMVFSGTI